MKNNTFSSKKIATAGIGAALALLAVIGAYYIPNLSLSLNVLAGVGLLVPLSQRYYKEALLAYVAAAGLGAIFVNIHILAFVLVTGLYTVAAIYANDKKIKLYIVIPAGIAYGCLCFFILYSATSILAVDFAKLNIGGLSSTAAYILLNAVFIAALAVFHLLILWINAYLDKIVKKIIK